MRFSLKTTSDAKEYKSNAKVESYRSLLQKYLSVYCEDRYATGVVEVFAVPLPRVQVEVAEEVAEQAKEVEGKDDPSVTTGSTSAGATDAMEGVEEKEGASKEVEEGEPAEVEAETADTQDSTMSEVKDDPVETAKAMEEVKGETETKTEAETEAEAEPIAAPKKEEVDEETEGETKIVVHIVANKYKLSNFWCVSCVASTTSYAGRTHSLFLFVGPADGGPRTYLTRRQRARSMGQSRYKCTTLKKATFNSTPAKQRHWRYRPMARKKSGPRLLFGR